MEWAFVYMFVVLKIPLIAALWLVWWSVREEPASAEQEHGGGGPGGGGHHPRPHRPRPPRRGPHAEPVPRAPSRVRVRARVEAAAHR